MSSSLRCLRACAQRATAAAQQRSTAVAHIQPGTASSQALQTPRQAGHVETWRYQVSGPASSWRALSTDFPMLGVDPASFRDGPPAEGEAGGGTVRKEAFHRAADLTLGQLFSKMEAFAQEHTEPPATVDMSQGTLRIQSDSGGIQVRKDAEARLLQVSSPHNDDSAATADVGFQLVSEPGECKWEAVKGGGDLHKLLGDNLEDMAGVPVDLAPEPQLGYGPDPT